MTYQVIISPAAQRQSKKLDLHIQKQVIRRLRALATDPRPHDMKKLSGRKEVYRIRTGDYRILYQIRDQKLIVLVLEIGHRREVYG